VKDAESILQDALALPRESREMLVDRLYASLEAEDDIDPKIMQAWLELAERRMELYRRGEMKAVSADQFLRDARERLKK